MAEMMQVERWLTRRVLGRALFDIASSTYMALVPTFFGLYFTTVVAGGRPSANAWWGATAAASLLLAGVLAPIVGAHADRTGRWLRAVPVTTALCALAAVLLPPPAAMSSLAAGAVFVLAQVGYTLATSIYDSLVVDVAAPGQRGRISALGWALGMLGGIVAIYSEGFTKFYMDSYPTKETDDLYDKLVEQDKVKIENIFKNAYNEYIQP